MQYFHQLLKSKYVKLFTFIPIIHLLFPICSICFRRYTKWKRQFNVLLLGALLFSSVGYRFLPEFVCGFVTYGFITTVALGSLSQLVEANLTEDKMRNILTTRFYVKIGIILAVVLILCMLSLRTSKTKELTMNMITAATTYDEMLWREQLHTSCVSDIEYLSEFLEENNLSLSGDIQKLKAIGMSYKGKLGVSLKSVTYLATIGNKDYIIYAVCGKDSTDVGMYSLKIIPQ